MVLRIMSTAVVEANTSRARKYIGMLNAGNLDHLSGLKPAWEAPVSARPSITVTLKAGSANTIKFSNNSANAPDLNRIAIH